MKALRFVPFVAACTSLASPSQAQVRYNVVDLAPLAPASDFLVYGMNNHGAIVGGTYTPGPFLIACVLDVNGFRRLGAAPGGSSSVGNDINDSGWVVGQSGGHASPPGFRAMIDRGTGPELLPTPEGTFLSEARAINNNGVAAGVASVSGLRLPIVWENSDFRLLPTLEPERGAIVRDINNSGVIAGSTRLGENSVAVLWQGDQVVALPRLAGETSHARAINDARDAVGSSERFSGQKRACLWRDGELIELPRPQGALSDAVDINDDGLIIGNYTSAGSPRGFLTDGTEFWDLNTLIDVAPGTVLTDVESIDNAGRILGTVTFQGERRYVMLTPVPAPTAVALFCLCLSRGCWRPRRTQR